MPLAVNGKKDPLDIARTASGLSATDWTPVTFDAWVRTVRIKNAGTGVLSVGRANTGTHGAADNQTTIAAGASQEFRLGAGVSPAYGGLSVFGAGVSPAYGGLSVFGADGATHPIEWVLMRSGF